VKSHGKFVIVNYNEGSKSFFEMNGLKMGMQVHLGSNDYRHYRIDTDERNSSFIMQYEPEGRNFVWHVFDLQDQFHLTQPYWLETVCENTLIRIYREGGRIEIKRDLTKFEDRFIDFIPIEFKGVQITVSYYTSFKFPGRNRILLIVNPKYGFIRPTKQQYLIVIDLDTLKAYDCEIIDQSGSEKIQKVFFFNSDVFLGQVRVSATFNRIYKYNVIETVDE